jgi:hypothetical protein
VEAVVWDGVDEVNGCCDPGGVVRAAGRYAVDGRYGASITVRTLRAADDTEYDPEDLQEGPPVAYDQMAARLDRSEQEPSPVRGGRRRRSGRGCEAEEARVIT